MSDPTGLPLRVVIETGQTRTAAGVRGWPGLARMGRSADLALDALLTAAPRYQRALAPEGVPFPVPATLDDLAVVEEVPGNAGTDWGAPGVITDWDRHPMEPGEEERAAAILRASRAAFLAAFRQAEGRTLTTGPRGGGRSREKMALHLLEADRAYLGRLAIKAPAVDPDDIEGAFAAMTDALLAGLAEAAAGRTPAQGKRGGAIWPARYYAAQSAWHTLDHAWELEDRTQP